MITNKKIYLVNHSNFFDKIIQKKRFEIVKLINKLILKHKIRSVTDVGTTNDFYYESSNYIIRNILKLNSYKSISDQKIDKNDLFKMCLKKSITKKLSEIEIKKFSSDLIISSATIEHVGSQNNQINMIKNLIKLSKKLFIFTSPNRFYPIEFHTKLPLIHWLPKKIHRKILYFLGFKFFSKEKNLNILSSREIKEIFKTINYDDYKILNVRLFLIKSNLVVIGFKN
jgi:hypothetical protein